jgi:hypothetical protein
MNQDRIIEILRELKLTGFCDAYSEQLDSGNMVLSQTYRMHIIFPKSAIFRYNYAATA